MIVVGIFLLLGVIFTLEINVYEVQSTKDQILTLEEAKNLQDVDAILVLGCQVRSDGTPSAMLEDRLKVGISLYQNGISPNLLVSGDHGRKNYNEVQVMKDYAIKAGILSDSIYMDHAGFSTYESIYRAKDLFLAEKVVIVTQSYHLYRALHIANALGIEAYGVSADLRSYAGQFKREIREVLARDKDFVLSLLKVKPTYLGDEIPLFTSGDATND